MHPISSPPSSDPLSEESSSSATAWFGTMSFLRNPAFWIPVLVLGGLGAYHLAWMASGAPYPAPTLWTVACCLAAVALLLVLVKNQIVGVGAVVRFFLAAGGFGVAALGVSLAMGQSTIGTPATTAIVGVLAVLGGVFAFSAGVYLSPAVDSPSALGAGPRPLAEERFTVNGAEAVLRRFAGFRSGTNRLVDVCRPHLHPVDLHYIAYYVDGECRFSCDVLDDPVVDRFSDQVTPDGRRERYLQQARYLNRLMVGLNTSFRDIDSGILLRVVLDVERGALYYYWIDEQRFVIGVTLDQEMVDKADRKMVHVVDGMRFSLGHKRIEDLER